MKKTKSKKMKFLDELREVYLMKDLALLIKCNLTYLSGVAGESHVFSDKLYLKLAKAVSKDIANNQRKKLDRLEKICNKVIKERED